MQLKVNGSTVEIPAPWRDESLLDVLREYLGLVGTKYGCGAGLCGACTVLIDGRARRSCITRAADAAGEVLTIEGLAVDGDTLHPLQAAWLAESVPQCGYCQVGQIMSAVALLDSESAPSDADIDRAMSGNLCRCGTHQRIRKAVRRAAR